MLQSGVRRAALVLLAVAAIGVVVLLVSRVRLGEQLGFGAYPLGLLPVALLQVTARRQVVAVAVAAAVSTTLVFLVTGQPVVEAVAYGVGGTLAALAVLPVLRRPGRELTLRSETDLLRLMAAVLLSTAVLCAVVAAGAAVAGVESLRPLLLASAVNQLASLVLWLPLVLASRPEATLARRPERIVQWVCVLAATVLIYGSGSALDFVYVLLALVGWAGLRFSLLEVAVQLVVVRTVAMSFTWSGRGPHTASVHGLELAPELETVFAQVFLIVCSVAAVALNLSSSRQREVVTRVALAEAGAAADRQLISVVAELEAERVMVEQLRELDRVKDTFVSMVSHELRTPITNIMGYAEMLEEGEYGDVSDVQTGVLHRIDENSHRLLMLIDDLLTLSRLQSESLELAHSPVDLVDVVRVAERITLPRVRTSGLSLEMDLPTEPVVVQGDQGQLERVMVNLMSNAVKFTPRLGSITVRLRAERDGAVVSVCDTGYGISEEDQERLFSQFFRSSVAHERHIPGTGLGLSIVRAIVDGHGGRVTVHSTLGAGTEFRVWLPAASQRVTAEASADAP